MLYKNLAIVGEICMKYDGAEGFVGGAGHDVVYLISTPPDEMDALDVAALEAAGCHWSDEYDCWTAFV